MNKLPAIFYPETTDIYDMKNMPRLCYCIHALSMHMFKLGLAPQIHDLEGQLKFTAEEITAMQDSDIKQGFLGFRIWDERQIDNWNEISQTPLNSIFLCYTKWLRPSMFDIPL